MEIALLVCAVIGTAASVTALLPLFGFDLRIWGRPPMPPEAVGAVSKREKRLWLALVLAIFSFCLSAGAFFFLFRPRIVEKTIEKPVEKIVEKQVSHECPKLECPKIAKAPNQGAKTKSPTAAPAPLSQECAPGANCAQSSGQQGGVTAGQINIDTDRVLSPKEAADIKAATAICATMPFINVTASSGEAKRYASQFIDALHGAGCRADLELPIPGLRPNILGIYVGVRDIRNISSSAASLGKILSDAHIGFSFAPMEQNFFPGVDFVLIVGAK